MVKSIPYPPSPLDEMEDTSCIKCQEKIEEEKIYTSEDGPFCDHCMEFFNECGSCGKTFLISNMIEVIGMPEICKDCEKEERDMNKMEVKCRNFLCGFFTGQSTYPQNCSALADPLHCSHALWFNEIDKQQIKILSLRHMGDIGEL